MGRVDWVIFEVRGLGRERYDGTGRGVENEGDREGGETVGVGK